MAFKLADIEETEKEIDNDKDKVNHNWFIIKGLAKVSEKNEQSEQNELVLRLRPR